MNPDTKRIANLIKSNFLKPAYLLLTIILLSSHNLYIKMDTYFWYPNREAILSLYNGTFEESENIISRDRILDASIIAHGERKAIHPNQWQDQDSTITQLPFKTGEAGTYAVGVSTKARNIELSAEKFNDYLKHDGVVDMLEQRTKDSLLNQDAVESYQKHVKAIYQVGDAKTEDWNAVLGYPIEFVPLANPYEKYSGDKLEIKLLLDGKPLTNQVVYTAHIKGAHDHSHEHKHDDEGHSHSHSHKSNTEESHTHTHDQQLRTNAQGIVTVDLKEEGIYYLRTIHMARVTDNDELTHESKWATLTFEVSHQHDESTHTHEHEEGIPTWTFAVGSLLIVGLLFLIFRKKD